MATLIKAPTYDSLFKDISNDLSMITPYYTNGLTETDYLNSILVYWNTLVSKSFHWDKVAKNELDKYSSIRKINKYLKNRLLDECKKVINEIKLYEVTRRSALLLKKVLIEELTERMDYIKRTF